MEVPTNNRSSLNMLENITNKIWRILPVINIPQSWVLTYCMKHTEITEDVEKATMQCQYDGTDWDCTFIELVKIFVNILYIYIYNIRDL